MSNSIEKKLPTKIKVEFVCTVENPYLASEYQTAVEFWQFLERNHKNRKANVIIEMPQVTFLEIKEE